MSAADPAYRTSARRALTAVGTTTVVVSVILTVGNGFSLRGVRGTVAPLWWWLDRKGHRHWRTAILAGALAGALMSTVLELVAGGRVSQGVRYFDLTMTLLGAVPGGLVGLIMWRIAYQRVPEAAEAF